MTTQVDTSVAEGKIVNAVRTIIAKATPQEQVAAVRPASMKFGWPGGGQPLILANCDPYELDAPFPCRIVWARLKAGDARGFPVPVTATVDLQLSSFETFGGQTPVYGTGTIPKLTAQSKADLNLTGWHINLITGDTLTARLTAFSGTATWLTLSIQLRPTEVPVGTPGYVDASGAQYVDASGNIYVFRS